MPLGLRHRGEEVLELRVRQDVVAAPGAQASAQLGGPLLNRVEGLGALREVVGSDNGPEAAVALAAQVEDSQHLPSEVDLRGLRALILGRRVAGGRLCSGLVGRTRHRA
eukprot:14613392-Alexandrium_andersonii.AAC.1